MVRMLLLCSLLWLKVARADVPVPDRVLNPQTAPEAWNVIQQVTANLEKLAAEHRLAEIPVQASLASPSFRWLGQQPGGAPAAQLVAGANALRTLAQAARAGDAEATREGLQNLRQILAGLASRVPAGEFKAEIFHCPMHPEFASAAASTPCDQCGMDLVARRIPYSFLFMKPGQSVVSLTAVAPRLQAGRKTEVRVRLSHRDGSPVTVTDLQITHTQPIHLLIVDPSLTDYHHEHPEPTATPGEYVFSFTPAKAGPYRIFADLLPVSTSVQEYAVTDLPGEGSGSALQGARPSTFEAKVDDLHFALEFDGGNGAPLVAGRVHGLRVSVKDGQGQPMRALEPVMNAFAHMVGFHADYQTVVHLHPLGGEVQDASARGGPVMSFRLLGPKSGYLRLYCQVQVAGRNVFAPFDLNIER
ncbi:MAG: hypothetical protein JSR82_20595 [Verrucomicrobia bacterium]|nr:hypothetical protein [Verrucomicrobiota bacterium]